MLCPVPPPCVLLQRFAVNPRAFIVQTLSAAEIPLRAVFNLFKYLNDITDDDNNNDVAAITEFTRSEFVDAVTGTKLLRCKAPCSACLCIGLPFLPACMPVEDSGYEVAHTTTR